MAAGKAVRATSPRNAVMGIRQRSRRQRPLSKKKTTNASALILRGRSDLEVSRHIAMLALRLKVVYAMAISVQLALCHQDAEFDSDLADCLRHGVCDPLADQISAAQNIVKRCGGKMPGSLP